MVFDSSGAPHGYLRQPSGNIISCDPPGSINTLPGAINPEGTIAGSYLDANGTIAGFIRSTKGLFTSFNVPGTIAALADGLTTFGASAGYCADSNKVFHGFIRYTDGTFTKFDAPGAGTTPNSTQGTTGEGMNDWVAVVGYLIDDNNVAHGFIRFP